MANNDIHFMRKELDRLQTKVANFDVTTEYAQSTSDTTAPTTGWSTTKPAPEEGKFVWARNIMNMGYGDVISEPYCIGDGLEHILSIDVEYIAWSDAYQSPPQSSEYWQTTAPSIQAGQYIWTRTKMVTTYGTNYTDPVRVTGIEGADGQDGVSIKGDDGKGFDFIYYTSNTAPSTPSDNVVRTQNQYNAWCDSPTQVDATHPYIYMSLRTTDNNGDWGHWSSPVKMSSIGEKGEDGEGFEIVFTRTNSDTPVPTFSNGQGQSSYTGTDSQGRHYQDADFLPTGWTDNQQGVDSDHQYEWASFRFKTVTNGNASWGNFNTPKIWATYSEDGTSSYIHIRYADTNNPANSSQVYTTPHRYIGIYIDNTEETNANKTTYNNPSLYSWSLFKPQEGIDFDGKFLHMKYASDVTFNLDGSVNTVTFTGNNGEDAGIWLGTLFDYTVADSTNGADYTWTKIEGNGISSMQEQYAMSTSYTTAPTTGWSNTPLENEVGKFYWTRTVISFTDGTSTTTNAICVSGADGDGVHNAYYCTDTLSTPTEPTYSTDISANSSTQSQNYDKWVEDPVAIDSSHKYIYITTSTSYEYVNGAKRWKNFSEPALWSRYALDGTNGTNGSAGIGYEYAYKTVSSPIQSSDKPSGDVSATTGHGWTKVPVPMTTTYKYMYISYRTVQGSTKSTWSNSALWSKFGEDGSNGEDGKDGLGMEHIFYLTNTEVTNWGSVTGDTNPVNWTTQPNTDDYVKSGSGWSDDATGVDSTHKYEYCSIRRKEYDTDGKTAKWGAFSTPSLWAKFGEKGDKGDTGDAGQGFEYVYKLHGSDSTPTTPSGNITNTSTRGSWATKPLSMDSTDYPYTFISYRTSDENGDWGSWSTPALWSKFGEQGEQGDKGVDGIGMEHIFCRTDKDGYIMTNEGTRLKRSNADVTLSASSNSNPALWSANQSDDYYDTSWGWYDNAQGVTESIPYEYVAIRTKRPNADGDGVWGTFTAYKLWAKFGADGKSITRVVNYYVASDSGSTAPSTGWKTDISQVTDFGSTKKYLWNYEKSYSGNTESDFVSESNAVVIAYWTEDGHEGKGISSVVEHYAVSSSSSSAPVDSSSDWHHTTDSPFVMPVTTESNKYLWNYETLNFTDGSHHDTTKRIIGTHGATGSAGKGYEYAYKTVSSPIQSSDKPSGDVSATSGYDWAKVPVPMTSTYKYMYISYRTIQGSTKSEWSNSALWSQFGEKGDTGDSGKDGLGMEHIFYRSDNEVDWIPFDDDGVGNTTNTYQKNRCSTSVDSTGTLMTATGNWAYLYLTSSSKRYALDFCIEFDLVSTSGSSCKLNIYDDTTERRFNLSSTGHYVLYVTSTGLSGTCNGSNVSHDSGSPSGATRVSFYISDNTHTLKFKNLKIYSMNNNPHYWAVQSTTDDYVKADSGWTDDASGVDDTHKYEYCCIRRKEYLADGKTAQWGAFDLPFLWAKFGEDGTDGSNGSDGERGTRIIEITEPPTHQDEGWAWTTTTYYYRKIVEKILSESGVSEVKIGDYLKYDTTIYLVGNISQGGQAYLVKTELAPDMDNIDASLLDGKESSEFMTSIPDIESISQTGGGAVECWKFGQLIITQVRGCVVTNTATTNPNQGWETLQSSNTDITLPSTYRPANTIIVGCGTQSGNNTKDMQLRLSNSGTLQFKRAGFVNGANGDSETVDATFVYFNDPRTRTSLTDTKNYNDATYGACIGDSLEVQLKWHSSSTDTTGTVMSGYPIVFSINNVSYQRTTDSEGKASLKLNLAKNNGTGYTWSAKYNGNNTYKSCSVGQTGMHLSACGGGSLVIDNQANSSIYRDTPFTGTVLNRRGQTVSGVTVIVTVEDSVSFSSTSDSNGKFKIYHPNDGIVYQNSSWYCSFSISDTNRIVLETDSSGVTQKYGRYLIFRD